MCKECHDKAPNTRSRTAFLHWAKQQSFVTNLYKELMDEIKVNDLENKIDQINEMFNNGIPQQIKDDSGIHFSRLKGPKITTSTLIAAISTYLEETDL